MRFHADATDDLGWQPTLEVEVPGDCEGGVYAVVLSCGGCEDVVPFVVRRAAPSAAATRVVLLPTFTYLAYSCERGAPELAASERAEDRWVAENRLLSLYDRHEDGGGAYEASLLRPLTQLRPSYRCAQHGGPHGLAQDLILLGFLERRGIAVDILTDHDLHQEGAGALAGHRAVITGAHPEYATAELLDALEAHVGAGGHVAYLGGNGLQGAVSVDRERPAVIEVRRNDTQALCWQADAGEHHHAATGLFGGDWRRHGRPERALLGVGLVGFGAGSAAAYERTVEPGDPAGDVIFEDLEPGKPIDGRGEVLGGPAGYEVDGADPRTGSPPDTKVLAVSADLAGYDVWPDDVVEAPEPGAIRAEMTLHGGDGRGFVFAVGSIAWTGCLVDDESAVARVTENALRYARARAAVPAAAGQRWLSRSSRAVRSTRSSSAPDTTVSSPPPTSPAPASGSRSSSAARSSAAPARRRSSSAAFAPRRAPTSSVSCGRRSGATSGSASVASRCSRRPRR